MACHEYVDGGSRTSHNEFFTIQVTAEASNQEGTGNTIVNNHGGGGCAVLGSGLLLVVFFCFVLANGRRRQ